MADVLVLGAGMVGVSTALALQEAGRDVVLADRKGPGLETSYGNAGVIQSEAVEPYPLPLALTTLLKIAFKRGNSVNYHWNALPSYLRPLRLYFAASLPARHKAISQTYAGLIRRATADHAPLIAAAGADNLIRRTGLRFVYRSQPALDAAAANAARLASEYGVQVVAQSPSELAVAEPHLNPGLAGAVYWPEAWSCADPGGLTQAYAALFASRGGRILVSDADTLCERGGGWAVSSHEGPVTAKEVVIALGPWSPVLLNRFGYDIPLLRKRGYHRHFAGGGTLNAPLLHDESATVLSSMVKGLRILTGAELACFDAAPTPVQLRRSTAAAAGLIDIGKPVEAEVWSGCRPCMPDMLPLTGKAPRHKGMWFHFGHGHQGFTLGPTTAALLAEEMITGQVPVPELSPARLRNL
ncbi:FAD-dependent oxidoreductase [Breoghania sp. L-A4]|uniref:NAD(P)/FAD-dependent oxidoreductase n=1 Tax=Breoghania sp. L-A4 TaxID=2304600 RepID=UPI000E35C55E|nr:FAD-dependent oxidoreductase [Breoghania sp. L-A4]AXS40098.1 FAD-binding oxidoreductase [Breoghania sp. L-A4]